MSNSTFIEEERPKGFWQERYEELKEKYDQLLKSKDASKMEEVDLDIEREIENEWKKCRPTDEGMGLESANIVNEQFDAIARHFYELGASVMRKRITNPEFNQKVIEKMKYECPVDEFNARKEDK